MGGARTRRRTRIPSRAENATGYSPSRAVMQWLACHDLGDAKIMASKSRFLEVAWPLSEAARILFAAITS
jgi:hypothetical protein